MSQTIFSGTERYIDKIEKTNSRREADIRGISQEVLYDTKLPDLDRAVLGLTGSPERLEEYRRFDEKITQSIGKPLVVVATTGNYEFEGEEERVEKAYGGIIVGGLVVRLHSPAALPPEERSTNIYAARMYIPVLPVVGYHYYGGSEPSIYINEVTDKFDKNGKRGNLEVAHIEPDYEKGCNNETGEYPIADSMDANTYIGRAEIYQARLFSKGLNRLLEVVEEA